MTGVQQANRPQVPTRRGGAAWVWDRLSLIPSVLYQFLAGGGVGLVGALGAMAFDGCGAGGDNITACEIGVAAAGWYGMLALVGASILATLVVGIVFWVRGRLVWPIAAAGAVLATLALIGEIIIQEFASRPR